jgi:hypothetical protein
MDEGQITQWIQETGQNGKNDLQNIHVKQKIE